ncbi:MAG: hypothetical protein LBQ12_05875 [Deltaproteobacteria bacterium]|nr:hypothetical protein [Deltaproteobacteria bacterium]
MRIKNWDPKKLLLPARFSRLWKKFPLREISVMPEGNGPEEPRQRDGESIKKNLRRPEPAGDVLKLRGKQAAGKRPALQP